MDEDNNKGVIAAIFCSIREGALNSRLKSDPETPRDPLWLRWLKFAAVIIVPALIVGAAFLFLAMAIFHGSHRFHLGTGDEFYLKYSFPVGAGIGALFGLIYVVRCIINKTDP